MSTTDAPPAATVLPTASGTRGTGWTLRRALFSIPLGLAAVGSGWVAAAQLLGASPVPAVLCYAACAGVWVVCVTVYVVDTVRDRPARFGVDLRHPLFGPLMVYLPVIAILFLAQYAPTAVGWPLWLTYAAVAALAVNAAAGVARWASAPLDQDATQARLVLATIAGPFAASVGLMSVHDREAAVVVFGAGAYLWLLLGAVTTRRLCLGSPPPGPSRPVLSGLLSPRGPAILIWFAITPGGVDHIEVVVGGLTLFMLLVQLFFIRDHLGLPRSTQHWVFAIPLVVLAALRWAGRVPLEGWELLAAVVLVTCATALVALLARVVSGTARRAHGRGLVGAAD